jgi:hypothetical protein
MLGLKFTQSAVEELEYHMARCLVSNSRDPQWKSWDITLQDAWSQNHVIPSGSIEYITWQDAWSQKHVIPSGSIEYITLQDAWSQKHVIPSGSIEYITWQDAWSQLHPKLHARTWTTTPVYINTDSRKQSYSMSKALSHPPFALPSLSKTLILCSVQVSMRNAMVGV